MSEIILSFIVAAIVTIVAVMVSYFQDNGWIYLAQSVRARYASE